MLVRSGAARQPLPIRRLLSSAAPLRTGSRCAVSNPLPSLLGNRRLLTTEPDSRPWRKKSYRALVGFERNLATALDEHRFADDVPFEGLPPSLGNQYRPQRPQVAPYLLKPYNVDSMLILGDQKAYPPRQRLNPHGIPGDLDEMLSVFDACVRVGRLDRASLVLQRFARMNTLEPAQALELHNRYLQGRVAQLMAEPHKDKADEVHKWFELRIKATRLPFTPITIAYMLKTTLLTPADGTQAARIDRYMSMMPEQNAGEPLDLGNVLSDEDLATIAEICPSYYVPEDVSAAADVEALEEDEGGASGGLGVSDETTKTSTSAPEVLGTPQKGMGLKSLKMALSMLSELPEGLDIASLPMSQRREVQARLEKDCVDAAVARWRDENESLMGMGLNTQLSTPSLNSKLYDWHQALEARLAEEQAKVEASESVTRKSKEDMDRCVYGPHMLQSPPKRLAAVAILGALSSLAMHGADKGIPVANMVQQLAKIAEEDIRAQQLARNAPNAKSKTRRQQSARQLMRLYDSSGAPATTPDAAPATTPDITADAACEAASEDTPPPPRAPEEESLEARWPMLIKAKFGAVLLASLMDTAKIVVERQHPETKEKLTQTQPAFTHAVQLKKGRKVGVIQPNRELIELMKREPRGEALARHLPMVVEPVPWSKFDKGGFVASPNPLVRLKNHERDQRIYAEAAIERGDMEQMMKGLDVLGKTAWKINRPVFDVMLEAWNSGEEFANLPALDPKIAIPPEPDSTDDPMKKRVWLRSVKAAENEKSGLHSVRCFMNFQLEIARAFRDQTFYFPHNIDFRGRAYPMPTYLNHMGADHMRGMLLFAKGRPLGERGLAWLKVQLSNVYGFDKASLQEREDFATKNLENIFDSADNPLTGKRWWLEAEDPWQCLGACFELKAALSSPDPKAFISHLPVHQDGTCNGLQHYAALGGDTWGAQQVNLLPGDRPADVYSAVAQLVQEEVGKDLAKGNEFAKAVDGKITRKVVKQTVMTNVYGVTFIGAKKQVQKQLESLYPDIEAETGMSTTVLASYLAAKVFLALSTMFRGAHDIQSWLGEIGGRVCRALTPEQLERIAAPPPPIETAKPKKKAAKSKADVGDETANPKKTAKSKADDVGDETAKPKKTAKSKADVGDETAKPKKATKSKSDVEDEMSAQFRNTLVWTTPLRMPVVQPYRKSGTRMIATCLQDLVLTNVERDDPVNRRKQLQAFPPNFIHSLDASHMMLSALECNAIGLTFAAVHDSFWTHAADVDDMNAVIRDSFIRIHQEDVIGRLKAEFEARYRGSLYRAKVDSKTEVGKALLYFRKSHRMDAKEELLQERQRQMLLHSMDPEEVRQGREMETPASIFESMATPDMIENEVDPHELLEDADGEVDGHAADGESAAAEGHGAEGAPEEDKSMQGLQNFAAHLKELHGTNYFEMEMDKPRRVKVAKSRTAPQNSKVSLWLPLTFPAIPQKGDFDVKQLKGSKYFFS